jgi:serpin B
LQDAERIFAATPQPIDFTSPEEARATINRWVSSKTNSLITKLLPPGSITPSTVSTLVNALYFKAPWSNQFQRESTKDAPFWIGPGQEPTAPLMYQSERAAYFENDSWQGVHLSFQRNEFYFLLLVPKHKLSTPDLLGQFSPTLLDDALTNTTFTKVNLHMPRFTIRQSQNITDKLLTTGLTKALSGSADYSGIASIPIAISRVQHEAVVIVDEYGTEAAAATAVAFAGSAFSPHPPDPKEVHADHPFVFAIIHRDSRAPLFLGVVGDPR